MDRIAVVVPAYNEENRLNVLGYFNHFKIHKQLHFIFVNDGSVDNTKVILDDLAHHLEASLITLSHNVGKAEAIRFGFQEAMKRGGFKYIAILDSDGAFSLESVLHFFEKSTEVFSNNSNCQCIISSRVKLSGRNVQRRTSRHYLSRILITFLGFFISELPYDTQSGLKVFRNSSRLRKAITQPFATKWFFDIELMLRADWIARGEIWEEPVIAWKDIEGSHINWRRIPQILFEVVLLLKIARLEARTPKLEN